MVKGGKVGRDLIHIYRNVVLLLLQILQHGSLKFNTAHYITYDVLELDIKDDSCM
jgi:hypothetical protein